MRTRTALIVFAFVLILNGVVLAQAPPAQTAPSQAAPVVVASPNGQIQMSIATLAGNTPSPQGGQLAFQVTFGGKQVFRWSQLGMEAEGQPVLGSRVKIVSSKDSSGDETYQVVHGKSNPVRDRYNAVAVDVEEAAAPNRRMTVEARVFDDGAAFRYIIPKQPGLDELRLVNERTRFNFSKDATTYPLILASFRTSYEDNYVKLPLSALKADSLVALPLLTELPGVAWVALTEAHIENYAGMYLTHSVPNQATQLESRLAPVIDNPKISVVGATPVESPWRVMMIADQPGRLIESNMVINLNPPCALADTSWIKPGRSAWDWWSGSVALNVNFQPGMNTATMKYYIDFAASAKFEYMLIDAGWSGRGGAPGGGGGAGGDVTTTNPNINMPELVEYARSKNVRLWLWAHWTAIDRQMNDAFPLYQKWGIAGVKIDFMDRDDQWMVDFYHRVLKKAAENHLMIDFHGAMKPDGTRRTWPNLMTQEGVLGLEYNRWSARDTPEHNVMLAFTRLLAGPMDFTAGGFNNVTPANFEARVRQPMVMGTRAHQTALFVVYESPFMVVADHPGAYAKQKELDFLRVVPPTWDETRVLAAKVGSYVAVARRSGNEWYVGAITGWDPVDLQLPLNFLAKGDFITEVHADAPDSAENPVNSVKDERKVTSAGSLKLRLVSGGGAAIRIRPAK
jgi:alpha-glucosidase